MRVRGRSRGGGTVILDTVVTRGPSPVGNKWADPCGKRERSTGSLGKGGLDRGAAREGRPSLARKENAEYQKQCKNGGNR